VQFVAKEKTMEIRGIRGRKVVVTGGAGLVEGGAWEPGSRGAGDPSGGLLDAEL